MAAQNPSIQWGEIAVAAASRISHMITKLHTSRLRSFQSLIAHKSIHAIRSTESCGLIVDNAKKKPLKVNQCRTVAATEHASSSTTRALRFCCRSSITAGKLLTASMIAEAVNSRLGWNPTACIQSGTLQAVQISKSQRNISATLANGSVTVGARRNTTYRG